jgi:hypothetical protein
MLILILGWSMRRSEVHHEDGDHGELVTLEGVGAVKVSVLMRGISFRLSRGFQKTFIYNRSAAPSPTYTPINPTTAATVAPQDPDLQNPNPLMAFT